MEKATDMPTRRKVIFQGQSVDADIIEFEPDREQWSSYILHDGTAIKIKAVVAEVLRLSGVFAPNGDPIYMVQAQQILHVSAPDTLRKQ
jgi:hypothetical protein